MDYFDGESFLYNYSDTSTRFCRIGEQGVGSIPTELESFFKNIMTVGSHASIL